MNLYLVRHGLSTGNVEGRLQGHWDTDLTAEGLRQAGATGRFLAQYFAGLGEPVAAVYTSDLKRARHTAEALGRHLNLVPQLDPGLREMHAGLAEGMTYEEWRVAHPEIAASWEDRHNLDWGWPGGETRRQMRDRIVTTVEAIQARHSPNDTVILVTHGGVIHAYLNNAVTRHPDLAEAEIHAGNCSIHHIQFSPDGDTLGVGCLLALNQTAHLDDLPSDDVPLATNSGLII